MESKKSTPSKRRRRAGLDAPSRLEREKIRLELAKMALAREEWKLAKMKKADAARAEARAARAEGYEPTLEALSSRFGLSRQTLAGMMKQPGAPRKHGNKGYLVREWGAWLLEPVPEPAEKKRLREMKMALLRIRTEELKRKNAETEERFVSRERAEYFCREYGEIVLSAVERMPQIAAKYSCGDGYDALVAAARETIAEVRHIVAEYNRGLTPGAARL